MICSSKFLQYSKLLGSSVTNTLYFFYLLVSGEPTKNPVLSPKSGRIFERSLIESYISQHGTDPIASDTPLSVDELISIQIDSPIVPPRPPTLTSVPSLLAALQTQWDALALETFTLRQQLASTRQELSTALYYHDSAVRVVARLTKERDEARDSLAKLSASIGTQSATLPEEQNETSSSLFNLPSATIKSIEDTKNALVPTRKNRAESENWATISDISNFHGKRASKQNFQQVRDFSLGPQQLTLGGEITGEALHLLAGGASSKAGIFNILAYTKCALFTTKTALSTSASWLSPNLSDTESYFALGTKDNTIEFYSMQGNGGKANSEPGAVSDTPLSVLELGKSEGSTGNHVNIIKQHPVPNLIVSLSASSSGTSWSVSDVSDITAPTVLCTVASQEGKTFTSLDIHPDGHIMAVGTSDGVIEVYSFIENSKVAEMALPGNSSNHAVSAIRFCENGYWLAASYENNNNEEMEVDGLPDLVGTALIWDIRKMLVKFTVVFEPIKHAQAAASGSKTNKHASTTTISRLEFDLSGKHLAAVAGTTLAVVSYIKSAKQWTPVLAAAGSDALDQQIIEKQGAVFSANVTHTITGVLWGPLAKSLYIVTDKGAFQEFSMKAS